MIPRFNKIKMKFFILILLFRLATNEKHYLSSIMHIRDPRHKRLLMIKATDVVLFGPPQRINFQLKFNLLINIFLV